MWPRQCDYRGQRPTGRIAEPRCACDATHMLAIGQYAGAWFLCDAHVRRVVELYTPTLREGVTMRVYAIRHDPIFDYRPKLLAVLRERAA